MKVLALNCSSEPDENLEFYMHEFLHGLPADTEVTHHTVRDLDIKPCYSCTAQYSFQYDTKCRCEDDMNTLYPIFRDSDVWIFAVKVAENVALAYLRNILDRMEPLFQPVYFLDSGLDFSSAPDFKLKGKIGCIALYESKFKEKAVSIVKHIESLSMLFEKKFAFGALIESESSYQENVGKIRSLSHSLNGIS